LTAQDGSPSGPAQRPGAPADEETLAESGLDHIAVQDRERRLQRGTEVGRYVVLERVGAGAVGVVYAAYDPELDRKIALKLLRAKRADRTASEGTARLLREAQAMARIEHVNVIAVHDVGTFEDSVFVAMEFVDGCTLGRWMRSKQRPWREVLDTFIRAGRGLEAAHARSLVHRDFKPDNVLIGNDGRVRVVDFGLARGADDLSAQSSASLDGADVDRTASGSFSASLTRTGAVVGTPAYMAPEQHVGAPAEARSDQFAFCVALYEGLYGQRPFEGATRAALAYEVTQGRVGDPPRGSRVPGWLRNVLLRGLKVSADERYADMKGLLSALERDPAAARRRVYAVAGLAAVISGGVWLQQRSATEERSLCAGAEERLGAVWSPERGARARSAFLKGGRPYAEATWSRAEQQLETYAQAWTSMYVDACEATHVRGEQSEELLDLRMSCLSQRLARLDALVGMFAEADDDVVEHAVEASHALPGIDTCGDADALLAPIRPPDDEAGRQAVADVREQIAGAAALRTGGRYDEALAPARAAVASSREIGYRPVEAEAILELGLAEVHAGDFKAGEGHLLEAMWAAEAGKHDTVAADALIRLVSVVGKELERHADGHLTARHAEAALERLGGDAMREADLLSNVGTLLVAEGKYEEALQRHERALALREPVLGAEDPRIGASLGNLGTVLRLLGRYQESRATHERALAVREAALGADHPETAKTVTNLANVLRMTGENERALELQQRAVASMRASLSPDHPHLAKAIGNLGNAYWALGRNDEAVAHHRQAAAVFERLYGPDHPGVAHWLDNAGVVLVSQDKVEEGLESHERALTVFEASLGPDHPSVAYCLTNIGDAQGRLDRPREALATIRRALSILESALGKEHPDLAVVLVNLGNIFHALGRHRESIPHFERALRLDEKALGPDHVDIAYDLYGIGRAEIALGRFDRAVAPLQRAVSLREEHGTDAEELGDVRFALARALWEQGGGDRARARQLAEQARDAYLEMEEGADPNVADVKRWLARHRAPKSD
jgi:tetratricopeptide (TPR) repeat protein/tRNA A-37 threonylcarbamoyl transferase component Bud32